MSSEKKDSELARLFLLGELDEQQRDEVRERLFRDEDFYKEVLAVEADLLDAFSAGRLSPVEKRRFRRQCLASPWQRSKLEFAQALGKELEAATAESPSSLKLSSFFKAFAVADGASLRAIVRVVLPAAAGLAGVFLLLAVWFQNVELREQMQSLQSRQTELEQSLTNSQRQSPETGNQRAEQAGTPGSTPIPEKSLGGRFSRAQQAPGEISLFLAAAVLRGKNSQLETKIPAGANSVKLQVEVQEPLESSRYILSLSNSEGKHVFRRANLKVRQVNDTAVVEVSVGAETLPAGSYEVELAAERPGGQVEPVQYSYFRVLRTP